MMEFTPIMCDNLDDTITTIGKWTHQEKFHQYMCAT